MPNEIISRLQQSKAAHMCAIALFGAEGDGDDDAATGDADTSDPNAQAGGDATSDSQADDDTGDGDEDDGDDDPLEGLSAEELRKAVDRERKNAAKARKEAQGLRKRAKTAEDKVSVAEKDQMTALERAQTEAKEGADAAVSATKRLRDILVSTAVETEANTVGFIDPSDVALLIDTDDIEVSDGDTIDRKLIKRRVKALAATKPHLVGTGSPAGSGDGSGRRPTTTTDSEAKTAEMAKHFESQGMIRRS